MNQLHISNYNIKNEPIIIKELSNILKPWNQYIITRAPNKTTYLEIIFEDDLSFTQLLNVKWNVEKLLEIFQTDKQFRPGEVQLIKQHVSVERQSIIKHTFDIKRSFQEFLIDTYFYVQLIDLKPDHIYPVIIHQMAKVFNKCRLLKKEEFYELLLNKQDVKYVLCKEINKETLAALELEHAALLRLTNREWYKLCSNINKQTDNYLKEIKETTNSEVLESDIIERSKIVNELVEDVFSHIFSFLNSNPTDNQQYIYRAYCFEQENKYSKLNYLLRRRR